MLCYYALHLFVTALLSIFPRYNTDIFHPRCTLGFATPAMVTIFRLTLKFIHCSLLPPVSLFKPILSGIRVDLLSNVFRIRVLRKLISRTLSFVKAYNIESRESILSLTDKYPIPASRTKGKVMQMKCLVNNALRIFCKVARMVIYPLFCILFS